MGKRLNAIYADGLTKAGVEYIHGNASFLDPHTVNVELEDKQIRKITVHQVLIATGGRPMFPEGVGIEEHCISSDGFFEMEVLPKTVAVVGAGYIAVELAGVLRGLGCETHLVVRKKKALRSFDPMIVDQLDSEM